MASTVRIAGVASLAEGDTRGFDAEREGERIEGFVIRHRGALVAFRNRCPHWNVDLDLGLGAPYDREAGLVFCRNHAALFRPHDGLCVEGPCAGRRLELYRIRVEGDDAIVELGARDED